MTIRINLLPRESRKKWRASADTQSDAEAILGIFLGNEYHLVSVPKRRDVFSVAAEYLGESSSPLEVVASIDNEHTVIHIHNLEQHAGLDYLLDVRGVSVGRGTGVLPGKRNPEPIGVINTFSNNDTPVVATLSALEDYVAFVNGRYEPPESPSD